MTSRFAVLLLVAGLLTGCSPRQYFAQPASVEETRDSVRLLERDREALKQRIEQVQKAMTEQAEVLNRTRADMTTQMEALADQLRQISSRLDDMGSRMERRSRPSSLPPVYNPAGEAPDGSGTGPDVETAAPPGDAGVPAGQGNVESEGAEQIYDQAYRDVTRGSYGLAVAGFNEFLRLFPEHDLADNAQYWLGECRYVQDDISGASAEFQKVLSRYPDGDKVAAAHLKLGYSALRMNDKDEARRQFNELIRKFPTSEEARSARAKLATLN